MSDFLRDNRKSARIQASRGTLPILDEGDYVLVARENFSAGEKILLRWSGPRLVVKTLNDYSLQVEDLRNENIDTVHGSSLKFYRDKDLDTDVIICHVISSVTGIIAVSLLSLFDGTEGLQVSVR